MTSPPITLRKPAPPTAVQGNLFKQSGHTPPHPRVDPVSTPTQKSLFKQAAARPVARPALAQPAAVPRRLAGTVTRVRSQNEEDGFYILSVRTQDGDVAVIGHASCRITAGADIIAEHCVAEESAYGTQFRSSVIHEDVPLNLDGMVAYLARSLDGVGRGLAQRIVDVFGADSYRVLDSEPERLLEVEGIGRPRLIQIIASRKSETELRGIWTALAPLGLGGKIPMQVLTKYGDKSLSVIHSDPYRLVAIPGVGFNTADKLALYNGCPSDSKIRIQGAVEFVFNDTVSKAGHTAIGVLQLLKSVRDLTGLDNNDAFIGVIQEMIDSRLIFEREIDGQPTLTKMRIVMAEKDIANNLLRIIRGSRPDEALADMAVEMSLPLKDVDQMAAVSMVYRNGVSVITGWPGCGKTTVTKVIADVAKHAKLNIVMCGPTNKSARRITDATGLKAATVYSALGLRVESGREGDAPEGSPQKKGGWQRNKENPLKGDLFVVDEFSMMDSAISRAYLESIPTGARLVLVGDFEQLPSVGAGNVLHDIIHSEQIPVTRLMTPHRTALNSDIIVNALKVAVGDVGGVDLKGTRDFRFRAADTDDQVMAATLETYAAMVDSYGVHNVQVLVSRYLTPVGVHAINKAIRQLVNPADPAVPSIMMSNEVWRQGDRVICTNAIKNPDGEGVRVTNGEVGVITGIDNEEKRVLITYGDRTVVAHSKSDMASVSLSYAMTTHKSQGSEFLGVVLVMPRSHKFMFNRNLFYTGMTRGKSEVVVVGDERAVRAAIAKPGSERLTGLSLEIIAAFSKPSLLEVPAVPIVLPQPARAGMHP